MMHPNELRIGNYVTWKYQGGEYYIVHNLCGKDGESESDAMYEFEPIPLTEEWLEKLGFQWDMHQLGVEYRRDDNDFTVYYHPEFADELESPFSRAFGSFSIYFKYVHHLQNVYYAMTGMELTIKTPPQK